jgi:hypothetical protein
VGLLLLALPLLLLVRGRGVAVVGVAPVGVDNTFLLFFSGYEPPSLYLVSASLPSRDSRRSFLKVFFCLEPGTTAGPRHIFCLSLFNSFQFYNLAL